MTIEIDIVNASTVVTDDQIKPIVAALQTQVSRDFAPHYGIDATLAFVPKGQQPAAEKWWIAVLDDSDQAGALGYHDLTTAGLPIGKVFAKTDIQYHDEVSVTLSHELLEMLGDPFINLSFTAHDGNIYAYEVGDPVEADGFGYVIDGVHVSDFVLPAYFQINTGASQTDFTNHLRKARAPTLTAGGYISKLDLYTGNWTQITGSIGALSREDLVRAQAPIGSRRWRRNVPLSARLHSHLTDR